MVTAEYMNQLLKNVLKLIKKNIGNENAPWMTRIAAYTQQIIINSSEELLKDPFLPLAERVKRRTEAMFHKEESLRGFIKSSAEDTSQVFFFICSYFPIVDQFFNFFTCKNCLLNKYYTKIALTKISLIFKISCH